MNEADCSPCNCPHYYLLEKARRACLACPRGGRPAGHGGQVSADVAGERVLQREAAYIDRSPRGQVTNLPVGQEDALGELFRRWCGLDTIDALLALHTSNGGKCRDFGAYLQRVVAVIDKLQPERPAMRATAWSKWQRIKTRIPILAKMQSWTPGHGGAKMGQGKGLERHFKDPAKESQRIENLRMLKESKARGAIRNAKIEARKKERQRIEEMCEREGPTGFRWLASDVQDGMITVLGAARKLGISSQMFNALARRLHIPLPHFSKGKIVRTPPCVFYRVVPDEKAHDADGGAVPSAGESLSAQGAPQASKEKA